MQHVILESEVNLQSFVDKRLEENRRIILRRTVKKQVWFCRAMDTDHWSAFVNMVMN